MRGEAGGMGRRVAAVLACLIAAALLAGAFASCKGEATGQVFRYDLPGPVDTLDPQFATDASARMILGNLIEGLLVQGPTGDIHPGVAERYTVSADGLTYTFTLRQDAAWRGGAPVTAGDFVYAFQRMFRDQSPFAQHYSAMVNALPMLKGGKGADLLGIKATGSHTLTFMLERPDPFFLERLCDPAAAPCSRELFEQARGRFGLEPDFVPANGPFYLAGWDNKKSLQLRRNEHYRSELPAVAGRVTLSIGQDEAERFFSGKTDLAMLDYEQQERLNTNRVRITPIEKTVWCIVFNQDSAVWGSPLLRQGLAHTVDRTALGEGLPAGYTPASVLVPGAIQLLGTPYRALSFTQAPLAFDPEQGRRLFQMGLAAMGRDQLPSNSTILLPEAALSALQAARVQQGWQKHLAAYLSFTTATPREMTSRFASGDYQMLLLPFTPDSPDLASFLGAYSSGSEQNHFGYRNVILDELLESAESQPTAVLAAQKYAQVETILLSDAVVIPLYFETTYLAVGTHVQDLEVSPFGDRIGFKYARKTG